MLFVMSLMFGCAVPEYNEVEIVTSEYAEKSGAESAIGQESESGSFAEESTGDEVEITETPDLCDGGIISPYAAEMMLEMTNTTERETIYSIYERIEGISYLFETCSDPWGMFATTYKYITARSIRGIEEGNFEDPAWAERIIIDFAGRYLDNLEAALVGEEPSWAWYRYYELADRSDVSKTRALLMAMSAHLLLDLPNSLAHIETSEENKEEFFMFGDLMIEVTEDFIDELDEVYGTDASDILNGFFLGQWVDGAFGADTTVTLSFQAIRTKSWNNRWFIQQGWNWMADADIHTSFWAVDAALRGLDGAGVID